MKIEVTEEAITVLKRSLELARIDPETGGVRLRVAKGLGGGASVQLEFADAASDDETVIETGGIRLFVTGDLTSAVPNPVVAVEPQHDRVVVRPGT